MAVELTLPELYPVEMLNSEPQLCEMKQRVLQDGSRFLKIVQSTGGGRNVFNEISKQSLDSYSEACKKSLSALQD
jgi:hypothetical protein